MGILPIAGPSYVYSSRSFDAQRSVNVYPVTSETGSSKAPQSALQGTPGLLEFCQPAVAPTRGSFQINGRVFFVIGNTLYEIFADATSISRGTLLTTSGFVDIATNPFQLCLVDGANGYIFTYATNDFTQITSPNWRGSRTVSNLDGFFIFVEPDTTTYYISDLNDGLTIDALDFAQANNTPGNIVASRAVHEYNWLLKTDAVQIIYNSGAADFPFSDVQGTTIQYGCAALGSAVVSANTIFWLGQDDQGKGIVWMAEGYQPQRISTYPVETAIQGYEDIENSVGYTYQEDGHFFYAINFISADTTWVYDIGLKQWHERAYFNPMSSTYERHRAQTHVFAFNKHLMGDYENGKIYEQSLNIYDDDGTPKRWLRSLPHLSAPSLEYVYYNRIQLDMQAGVGLQSGASENTNPQIMLRWSNDGGFTWTSEFWRSAGKVGEYAKRVIWNRCGRARDRVFEFSGTSNTKVFLIAAYVEAEQGTS